MAPGKGYPFETRAGGCWRDHERLPDVRDVLVSKLAFDAGNGAFQTQEMHNAENR